MMSKRQLLREALELPVQKQSNLIETLNRNLDKPDPDKYN